MAHYAGPPLREGPISIAGPPAESELVAVEPGDDFGDYPAAGVWHRQTAIDDGSLYFALLDGSRLVGQVMLHDIDRGTSSSLVGYHVFRRSDRGGGRATTALKLLVRYVAEQTDLVTLAAIIDQRNAASRRVASLAGFSLAGVAP